MSQTNDAKTTTETTSPKAKAAAKKSAAAPKTEKTTPPVKTPAKKPAPVATKAAPEPVAEKAPKAPRVSKYRDGIIKFLAQHPDGATDTEISGEFGISNSLRRVMMNDKDILFKWEQVEGVKGMTFSLTAAGKALAKKL